MNRINGKSADAKNIKTHIYVVRAIFKYNAFKYCI